MSGRFADRVALVTGASRGFGYAVAAALGAEGAQVAAAARTQGGLEELDDAIQAAGGAPATLIPMDLTDGDAVDRLGAALFERFGRVDVWVHTAAEAAPLTPAAHLDPPMGAILLALNVGATLRLVRSLDPLLKLSPAGVAVLSAEDRAGAPFWGGYGATKAAQRAFFESWAAETKELRILVHHAPPMPTKLRRRTHPGEDPASLTPCDAAAAALLTAIAGPG